MVTVYLSPDQVESDMENGDAAGSSATTSGARRHEIENSAFNVTGDLSITTGSSTTRWSVREGAAEAKPNAKRKSKPHLIRVVQLNHQNRIHKLACANHSGVAWMLMSRAACLIGFSTAAQLALQIADLAEWSLAQPRQHARHAEKIRGPMCNIICLLQNYRSTWLMSRVTRYSCSSLQRTMACTSLRIAINSLFMWCAVITGLSQCILRDPTASRDTRRASMLHPLSSQASYHIRRTSYVVQPGRSQVRPLLWLCILSRFIRAADSHYASAGGCWSRRCEG